MLNLNNQFNNSNEESKTSPLLNKKMVYITNHYNRNQGNKQPKFDTPTDMVNKQRINQT
jgi:hypothetical protein